MLSEDMAEAAGREYPILDKIYEDQTVIRVSGKRVEFDSVKDVYKRQVHVLTADTYGTVTRQCEPLGVEVRTFPREGAAGCKEEIVRGLEGGVACLGNGFNDIQMFDAARLSIAVLEREGMCAALLGHATVVVRSIEDGLDLLLKPDRLRATLRS